MNKKLLFTIVFCVYAPFGCIVSSEYDDLAGGKPGNPMLIPLLDQLSSKTILRESSVPNRLSCVSVNEVRKYPVLLSLDGGGTRGIIEAYVLSQLEKYTGKKIYELFHLVVGTSTGGIIGAGLTVPAPGKTEPYSAQELVTFFDEKASVIFPHPTNMLSRMWNRMRGLTNAAYNPSGLINTLQSYFGDRKLSESIKPLVLTSVDLTDNGLFLLRSYSTQTSPLLDFRVADACLATSAAPSYFPPAFITNVDQNSNPAQDYALVDGGMAANNPAQIAYDEAFLNQIFGKNHFKIFSIGTGSLGAKFTKAKVAYNTTKQWGWESWARPAIEMLFDAHSDATDCSLTKLMQLCHGIQSSDNTQKTFYYRFQPLLPDDTQYPMDGIDNLNGLKIIAYNHLCLQKMNFITMVNDFWGIEINKDFEFDNPILHSN